MKVLTSEGIKSLKHLVEAKVVFYNFDYAQKFLVENYDKVDQWWLNNYTQSQIKKFSEKFARNPKSSFNELVNILNKCKK